MSSEQETPSAHRYSLLIAHCSCAKIRAGGLISSVSPKIASPGTWSNLQLRHVTLVTLWLSPVWVLLAGQELFCSFFVRVGTGTAGRRPRREPVGRQLR